MAKRILKFLDRLARAERPGSEHDLEADRKVLLRYSCFFFVLIFSYGVLYWFLFQAKFIALFCVGTATICLISPLVLNLTKSKSLASFNLIIACLLCVFASSVLTGGIKSPIVLWLTCVPVVIGYLTRSGASVTRWVIVCMVTLVVIHAVKTYFNVKPEVDGGDLTVVFLLAILGIWTTNSAISFLFLAAINGEINRTRSKSDELENVLRRLESTQTEMIQQEKLAAVGILTAGVAHEIGNSLTSLRLAASALEKQAKRETPSKAVIFEIGEVFKFALGHIQSVIQSLSTAVKSEGKREWIDLADLLKNIELLLSHKIKNIELKTSIPPGFKFNFSKVITTQVLINLISNSLDAIKTVKSPGIEVSVKCEYRKIILTVADNGPGLLPGQEKNLFDAFFTTKRDSGGTGLGLYVSRRVMRTLGGDLIKTGKNDRTEFQMIIPIQEAA